MSWHLINWKYLFPFLYKYHTIIILLLPNLLVVGHQEVSWVLILLKVSKLIVIRTNGFFFTLNRSLIFIAPSDRMYSLVFNFLIRPVILDKREVTDRWTMKWSYKNTEPKQRVVTHMNNLACPSRSLFTVAVPYSLEI